MLYRIMPYSVKILERQKIRKNGTNKPCSEFNADLIFAIKKLAINLDEK